MKRKEKAAEKRQSILMFLAGSLIVPILIAILAGVFGITQSVVDMIPWISENSGKTIEWQAFFDATETFFSIRTENNKSVMVKPPLCNDPFTPELKSHRFIDTVNKPIFQNTLVTQKTGVISHAIIELVKYTPPIDATKYDEIFFFTPPGMGSVQAITFPETVILQTSSKVEVWLKGDFIQLDPGDAVRIYLPLNFPEEGTYKFRIKLPLDIAEGKTHMYESGITEFSWVKIVSVSNFKLTDSLQNTPLQWGECP